MLYIGTASWQIPQISRACFSPEGSRLASYSQRLNAVEINSSFYREHLPRTYRRWAQKTPPDFKFSVKLSRKFSHEHQLKNFAKDDLKKSIESIHELGAKLGVILVQLPPKLFFDELTSHKFFKDLRDFYQGPLALEPRHLSWASEEAYKLLIDYRISIVQADPPILPASQNFIDPIYIRLHGSPVIYESEYSPTFLKNLWKKYSAHSKNSDLWFIFDNTKYGFATQNALDFKEEQTSAKFS